MKTIQSAAFAVIVAVTAAHVLPAFAQDVTSGYQRLSDGVYAFTADGGDGGVIVGCEQGTEVKIMVLRDFRTIEKYFCVEQLALQNIADQPVLVSAGFDANGEASALIMGVPAESGAWPSFYKLNFSLAQVSVEQFEASAVAGLFEEPGEWAFVCPFFAREETRDGFSSIYQTSYVYAMPDGSYAGIMWRESGIWQIEFKNGGVAVDRIYSAAEGEELLPVWSAHRSPKGKLAALVAETRPVPAPEPKLDAAVPAATEPDVEFAEEFEDESGGEGVDDNGENSGDDLEGEGGDLIEDPQDDDGDTQEEPAESGELEESGDENGTATEPASEPQPDIAYVRDSKVNLVLISAFGGKVWTEIIADSAPPDMMTCALAIDGRPFAFWFTPAASEGVYEAQYWGLAFADQSKVVPFNIKPKETSAPPVAAMRALGLPGLIYEEGGAAYLRMGNGSSPDWHIQEEFQVKRAAKQFGQVMGLGVTSYFILDGSSLFWHWHKNK